MVNCAPQPTWQGTPLRNVCYGAQAKPCTPLSHKYGTIRGKDQIMNDVMQHLSFSFRNFEKPNLKFSLVRFHLHLQSEIIVSWEVQFFSSFFPPLWCDLGHFAWLFQVIGIACLAPFRTGLWLVDSVPAWAFSKPAAFGVRVTVLLIQAGNPANWQWLPTIKY